MSCLCGATTDRYSSTCAAPAGAGMYLELSFFNDADGVNRGSFNGFSASALAETVFPDVGVLAGARGRGSEMHWLDSYP